MKTTANTTRIVALFAAMGMTTLLAASQLGLASHYAAQAGAVLAQQPVLAPAVHAAAVHVVQAV
jgi:hypothetical protein